MPYQFLHLIDRHIPKELRFQDSFLSVTLLNIHEILDRAVVVGVPHKAAINLMNKINLKTVSRFMRKDTSLYQSNLAGTDPEPSRIARETHIWA